MGILSARWAALAALALSCGGAQHGSEPAPRVVTYGPLGIKTDAKTPSLAVFLGTDDHNGSTLLPLPAANAKAQVDAMYVVMGDGSATGGMTPVKLVTAPNPDKSVQVGVYEEFAGGTGEQWRAGVWVAAIVAATVLGKDLTDLTFSAASGGYIDGASASGLMSAGFLAALTGAPVDPTVTMTGIINPDGTIGPVGGIPEKFLGSIAKGKRRLGYPIGMRMAKSEATGDLVDLVKLAKDHGAEAIEIADVHEAYKLLTHKSLPDTVPVAEADMALDAGTQAALDQKYKDWQKQLASEWTSIVQLSGKQPTVVTTLRDYAKQYADQAESLYKQHEVGAAYSRMLLAWTFATTTNAVVDIVSKVRAGNLDAASSALDTFDKLGTTTQAVFEKIGALKPNTLGGHLQMMSAFKAALTSWVYHGLASQSVAQASEALAALSGTPAAQLASADTAEQVANQVAPALLYLGRASAETTLAIQELDFEKEDSVMYMCSIPNVHRMATSFSSAGAAGLNYFDQLLVEPLAKQYEMTADQARTRFAMAEPDYLVAYTASKLADDDGLPQQLKAAWGEHSLAWGLLSLAGSELAYYNSAQLIAKYYSLGVHTDDNNKVDTLEYEQAFTNMLASAERNARANARAARIAAGAIPVQAKLAYQLATVERAGDLGDKVDALAEFWMSSSFSQTAVMLARN
ncbi:MAG TPA: S16 family serine protease [Kofleriaceae bacterium]|jgi:hypothetical protein